MIGDPRLPARFWAKVRVNEETGCWEWTASLTSSGYGQIARCGPSTLAHRVAYVALVGPVAHGLDLDHLCRTRPCVNPAHLEPVTRQVNLLRGATITATNAAKTHCPMGHAYSPENTYVRARNGSRECRTCVRDRNRLTGAEAQRRHRARERAEAVPR